MPFYTYRLRALALLVAASATVFLAAGCAGSGQAQQAEQQFRRSFRVVYERYQSYEPQKALALANGEEGRWAYGFARGMKSEMEAVNRAKQRCERERARYGVQARCQTYAVGNQITGDAALVAEKEE